jgi:hypothetical protein
MQYFVINKLNGCFHSLEDTALVYAKVMRLWQRIIQVMPLICHVIRYEDLVTNFEHESRTLLNFIQAGWHEDVLKYAEHAKNNASVRPVITRSRSRLISMPNFPGSAMPNTLSRRCQPCSIISIILTTRTEWAPVADLVSLLVAICPMIWVWPICSDAKLVHNGQFTTPTSASCPNETR